MKLDGRALSQKILDELKKEIAGWKIKPHMAVVLINGDPASVAYVAQKEKKSEEIGSEITVIRKSIDITTSELIEIVRKLNDDPKIHGIIVQRPVPAQIDEEKLTLAVDPQKDIDGFHPDSPHPRPLAAAVIEILKETRRQSEDERDFTLWLKSKNIVVIGKGETAGTPIIAAMKKLGANPRIIDSKTSGPEKLTKEADILISCVGKPNIVRPEMIKSGVILISVGMHQNSEGKLRGDYDEEKIKDIASFYTPVPGGVGPVNVAELLVNVVSAAKKSQNN